MAVPHISVQIIGRSQGRSAVAAAAYRSAERLVDARLGRTSDFSRKLGVVHTEILAPEGAPAWMYNRAALWNGVEAAENRRDAQVAREVQVALPRELSRDNQLALLRSYVQEHFVDAGMVADIAVHMDNPKNPHAHIMLTTRGLNAEGTGFGPKVRAWNAKAQLLGWREGWALSVNRALERDGHDNRIDHRSYVDQGIALEPTPKLGIGTAHGGRDGRDCIAERLAAHDATVRRNGEAILVDPEIALTGITRQRATFTRADMGRYLHTCTADAAQFQACLDKVMSSPSLVRLQTDAHGERLTTRDMLQAERVLVDTAHRLAKAPYDQRHGVDMLHIVAAVEGLAREPRQAVGYVLGAGNIVLVEGFAGTGKSTMLRSAKQAWDAGGYRVLGAALSGKAAEGLEASAGIASRSLASWEHSWKQGYDALGPKDIFVIDEAGLVGTRQMQRVVSAVEDAGAKIVLVGDSHQLQAIEAGAPFRRLAMEVGHFAMTNIQRQRDPKQREASGDFARGYGACGLDHYTNAGCVTAHADGKAAMAAVVDGWDRYRKAHPQSRDSQIMLAFRRVEVAELNAAARDKRVTAGELGPAQTIATAAGDKDFAVGDRLYFLRNDRGLGVKNGTLGTLEDVRGTTLQVRLDGPESRRVAFDLADYNHLDYGYAATVHKAQGVTVDQAHVLASSHFDRHLGYVAMTRHRDGVQLHYSQADFATPYALGQAFERARHKDMALDYALAEARNQAQDAVLREREQAQVMREREAVEAARAAQERLQEAQAQEQRRVQEAERAHAREQALNAARQSAEARQQQAERMDRERTEAIAREAQLPACEARVKAYESDTYTLKLKQESMPYVRSVQAVFDNRTDVRCARDALQQETAWADGQRRALRSMQQQEARFRQEHPIQAALGRHPPLPDHAGKSWSKALQAQQRDLVEAQALVEAARRRLNDMANDPGILAACRRDVARDQAHLADRQQEVGALQASLRDRATQQRQDMALCQAVERDREMRAERVAHYAALERDLGQAQYTAGQSYTTRDAVWQGLEPVIDAHEALRRSQIWRDQVAEFLQEHHQRMATYKQAHPIRAAFGASYRTDAHQLTADMQDLLREREEEVQRYQDRLQTLSADRATLDQAETRANAHNARIDKARDDVPEFERALHERAPQHAHDIEVQAQQRAVEREQARELDRGGGMEMSF